MKGVLNSFLTSGHDFPKDENLQKFRFALLNIFMAVSLLPIVINLITLIFGVIEFNEVFERATWVYAIFCIFFMVLLRRSKDHYKLTVLFFIASSMVVFYFVLFTHKEDEFRLIAFFLALFITNVLLGKNYGLFLAFLIVASVAILSKSYELEISSFAYSTFFTFFVIFTLFLYFFLQKVERDSVEFSLLSKQLKENINQEVQQREQQEQMLLRQCRMANMGEMMDSIAHQWRQPLMHINSILMNMENALGTKKDDSKYLEDKIDEVASLTTHMSQTIEDFRGLFKVENEYTHFKLQGVVNDVLSLMKNNLKDIDISYRGKEDVSIDGNRSELLQVVIILLGNAVEVLNIRSVENKEIIISVSTSNNALYISVEDNAGGVSQENLNTIFDPYFTTKEQSGGTGLGLYIAKIIIEQKMAGKISVSNTPLGAKFTIYLIRDNHHRATQ